MMMMKADKSLPPGAPPSLPSTRPSPYWLPPCLAPVFWDCCFCLAPTRVQEEQTRAAMGAVVAMAVAMGAGTVAMAATRLEERQTGVSEILTLIHLS